MDDRRTMTLDLCRGEQRQLLLEAGSMVLVLAGPIRLRVQTGSTTELLFGQELLLADEQLQVIEENGWVSLWARQGGQVVLIPADRISLWQHVGRCLETFLSHLPSGKAGQTFGRVSKS